MLRVICIIAAIVLLIGIAFEVAYTAQYMRAGFGLFTAMDYAWSDITEFIQKLFTVKAEYTIDIEYPMANRHIVWDNTHQ